ncbi:hypothetical protein LCGC14_1673160 [marine sediment metagenome]|uniref:Uncharacterized protein n=1 Tax=marine sediment metagenome TaxID=412755 RepID=A0A0F9K6I4_9ZZZZ
MGRFEECICQVGSVFDESGDSSPEALGLSGPMPDSDVYEGHLLGHLGLEGPLVDCVQGDLDGLGDGQDVVSLDSSAVVYVRVPCSGCDDLDGDSEGGHRVNSFGVKRWGCMREMCSAKRSTLRLNRRAAERSRASKSIMSLYFDIDDQGLGVVGSDDFGGNVASFDGKRLMRE